jgi:hypothetical protein
MFSYLVPNWQEWKMILIWLKNVFSQTKSNSTKLRKKPQYNNAKKENAFWNLRAEDDSSSVWCSFVLLVLYAIGYFFDLDYLKRKYQSVSGAFFVMYLSVFAAIFEFAGCK